MTVGIFKVDVDDLAALETALARVRIGVEASRRARLTGGKIKETRAHDPMDTLAVKAAAIYAGRRARDRVFDGLNLFADPAWDIMLDLFVGEMQGRQISVSSVTIASAVPPTTGLRWVETLLRDGVLERVPDANDRRRVFVRLTERGLELVTRAIEVS